MWFLEEKGTEIYALRHKWALKICFTTYSVKKMPQRLGGGNFYFCTFAADKSAKLMIIF